MAHNSAPAIPATMAVNRAIGCVDPSFLSWGTRDDRMRRAQVRRRCRPERHEEELDSRLGFGDDAGPLGDALPMRYRPTGVPITIVNEAPFPAAVVRRTHAASTPSPMIAGMVVHQTIHKYISE